MLKPRAPFGPDNPVAAMSSLIGNTPLLELQFELRGRPARVFAKYESLNFTGSIKDRMALHVLGRAYEEGAITPRQVIVEATSGNTGIALCALGRALGHEVRIYMPDWMSEERVRIMQCFGADVVSVSAEQGGFVGSIDMAERCAKQDCGGFLPRQFANPANVDAHARGTGPEILAQLASIDLRPDAFVAGVGTGGTVMGVARALREHDPRVRVHPLEPASSPVLSAGRKVGSHRIAGISDEFVPEIVQLGELDAIVSVDDGDAILMAQQLARTLGLGVGISSGANVVGALRLVEEMGHDAVVTTVLADSHKKYLSTDLFREEAAREEYLTPHARALAVRAIPAF